MKVAINSLLRTTSRPISIQELANEAKNVQTEFIKWKAEYQYSESLAYHADPFIKKVISSKTLSINGKLDFLSKILYYAPKAAYVCKDFLISLYNDQGMYGRWKVNLIGFYCIEQNCNPYLITNFKNSLKLGLDKKDPDMIRFLQLIYERRYKISAIHHEVLLELLKESIETSSFFIKDLETLAILSKASKYFHEMDKSYLANAIIDGSIVPFIRGCKNRELARTYTITFLNGVYPYFETTAKNLIRKVMHPRSGERNYYMELFTEKSNPSLAFSEWVNSVKYGNEAQINDWAMCGRLEDIIKMLLSCHNDFTKCSEITKQKAMKYYTSIYSEQIFKAIDVINQYKPVNPLLLKIALKEILKIIIRKWGIFIIDDLVRIRDDYLKLEGDDAIYTSQIEAIIRRYISCWTNIMMPHILTEGIKL